MPPRAATLLVRTQVRNHLVGVVLASLHGRVLPTIEVQIPGLHGGTWRHQQRPANLVCLDTLPGGGQVMQPHPGGACESSPNNRPNSTKMQAHESRSAAEAKPSQRERDCGSFTDAVWLRRIELQNGAQTSPQPASWVVANSAVASGSTEGAGSLLVLSRSGTTAAMRSGRRGPWVCAPTRHVAPPPLTPDVGPHRPHAPGECPTPSCFDQLWEPETPLHTLALGLTLSAIHSNMSQIAGRLPARFHIFVFLT